MKQKKKQELLTNELIIILKQAQDICTKYSEKVDLFGLDADYEESIECNNQLGHFISGALNDLGCELSERKKHINFEDYQLQLEQIFKTSGELSEQIDKHLKKDVVSDQMSVLNRIMMKVTQVLRGVFEIFGKIFPFTIVPVK